MDKLLNNLFKQFIYYAGYDIGGDDTYGVSYDSGGGSSKEMTLKKVYELALTAIAYLAFGIFVLQVIMCITTVCHCRNFFFTAIELTAFEHILFTHETLL